MFSLHNILNGDQCRHSFKFKLILIMSVIGSHCRHDVQVCERHLLYGDVTQAATMVTSHKTERSDQLANQSTATLSDTNSPHGSKKKNRQCRNTNHRPFFLQRGGGAETAEPGPQLVVCHNRSPASSNVCRNDLQVTKLLWTTEATVRRKRRQSP